MPTGNRRPLYDADEVPAVREQPAQLTLSVPGPQTAAPEHTAASTGFKQPCTLKGLSAALYAGALGYFLGFVPATIKFKARQWGMVHSQGMASASQLALMSGMYTTVHCICQRIRMVEDGWNRGIAGCSTGLVLGWKSGPWGALQSCASLGILSALIDLGGGAVDAAEAAVLSQLHDLQQQHKKQQGSWGQAADRCHTSQKGADRDIQQAGWVEQVLDIVASPCTAMGRAVQHMQQYSHQQGVAGTLQQGREVMYSSSQQQTIHMQNTAAAPWAAPIQPMQQLLTTPPLMFLGACCPSSSQGTPVPEAATDVRVVDGCELDQKFSGKSSKGRSRKK